MEPCGPLGLGSWCCPTREDCQTRRQNARSDRREERAIENLSGLCDNVSGGAKTDCTNCFTQGSVWTAVGCIPTEPSAFIGKFLGLGIGVGGGIALLLILFGGFQILTSAGNPEQLNAGRELVGSAITGLLLIIFSIFLLKVIGVDILGIPTFTLP